ncbi:hypothetical protein [Pseudomonas sp. PDM04]|uniref:hypothetical protein n=1 Tax=Pseudomonas sp. PDM04 TaxID=2769296 RepID=UPI00178497F9|nr:hypothetical protein [Pseudomonas sp. PDM04]MBD9439415.1 hypothetical protein [Pseudomonas sp. PDM04]
METGFMWWLGLVSSIASIGSAVWAWREALNASDSASEADALYSRMISSRQSAEAHQVLHATRTILQAISPIGPSGQVKHIKGIDLPHISRALENYCQTLSEHGHLFSVDIESHAVRLSRSILNNLPAVANKSDLEGVIKAGTLIYIEINNFMPVAKQISDERMEDVK